MIPTLILFDMNEKMCRAWGHEFKGVERCSIFHGTLDDLVAEHYPEMISSAANCFGIMGAGLDGAMRQKWPEVQPFVQDTIKDPPYYGELMIGQSVPVRVEEGAGTRWVAYTPTMRYPGQQTNPQNVYFAARAAILLASRMGMTTLALPGMGTGIGRVLPGDCAAAQRSAYQQVKEWEESRGPART